MTTIAYTPEQIDIAIKTIGEICKERGVSLEDLRAAFPNRPTTAEECTKIAVWLSRRTWPSPIPAPSSQGKAKFVTPEMLPEGNYAIPYNGKTHFYRVSHTEGKGKWQGRTFVNVKERASDELYIIDNRKRETAIKWAIVNHGVEAARELFSEKLGRCWRCYKVLTDETNPYKQYGLGPDCGPEVMG